MSGGTLVLRYAPKIAEMNDSDPYLFKTSKFLKIVENKNIYGLAQVSDISENPLRRLKKTTAIWMGKEVDDSERYEK